MAKNYEAAHIIAKAYGRDAIAERGTVARRSRKTTTDLFDLDNYAEVLRRLIVNEADQDEAESSVDN